DYKVTGVQTCALPILMLRDPSTDTVAWAQSRSISAPLARRNRRRKLGAIPMSSRTDCGIQVYAAPVSTQALSFRERNPSIVMTRSEERRVGKECRTGV